MGIINDVAALIGCASGVVTLSSNAVDLIRKLKPQRRKQRKTKSKNEPP